MVVTNLANPNSVADPLKGLLMDKGAAGLSSKIQNLLQKLAVIHGAMDELVAQQRLGREEVGSESLDLYLATNIKKELVGSELIKKLSPGELSVDHTKAPLVLEWRARLDLGNSIGCPRSARMYAFQKGHAHYDQLKNYVDLNTPGYYETLVGYDILRVTLNNASRQLRKVILDLMSVYEETAYMPVGVKLGESRSKRILKGLSTAPALLGVLEGLYCY